MMAGVILRADGDPKKMLPSRSSRLLPGKRFETTNDQKEIGRAPSSLQRVARLTAEELAVERVLELLTDKNAGVAAVGDREAASAVAVAELLGWARFAPAEK
jgi:hypothetical protein